MNTFSGKCRSAYSTRGVRRTRKVSPATFLEILFRIAVKQEQKSRRRNSPGPEGKSEHGKNARWMKRWTDRWGRCERFREAMRRGTERWNTFEGAGREAEQIKLKSLGTIAASYRFLCASGQRRRQNEGSTVTTTLTTWSGRRRRR